MVYQSQGFRYVIYSVWIGCPIRVGGWVGGWLGGWVVFAETKDQQGLINKQMHCINKHSMGSTKNGSEKADSH